jgi:hypothetical protein
MALAVQLHKAALRAIPLTLVMLDGTRCAGMIIEAGLTFCRLRLVDGVDIRIDLVSVHEALRHDGRRYWPPTRETRS